MQPWNFASASQRLSSGSTGRRFAAFGQPADTTIFHREKWTDCCFGQEQKQSLSEPFLCVASVVETNWLGRIERVQISGLMAEVDISIGEQHITSIITARSAREMNLKPGQTAAALIKATEVMILRV
jgi:molybdopterin-binding protein